MHSNFRLKIPTTEILFVDSKRLKLDTLLHSDSTINQNKGYFGFLINFHNRIRYKFTYIANGRKSFGCLTKTTIF